MDLVGEVDPSERQAAAVQVCQLLRDVVVALRLFSGVPWQVGGPVGTGVGVAYAVLLKTVEKNNITSDKTRIILGIKYIIDNSKYKKQKLKLP